MRFNDYTLTDYDAAHEVPDLEDCYAQALADGADALSLSLLWERIKLLKRMTNDTGTTGTTVFP